MDYLLFSFPLRGLENNINGTKKREIARDYQPSSLASLLPSLLLSYPTFFSFLLLPSLPPFLCPALTPSLASEGVNGQAVSQDTSWERLPVSAVLSENRVI